jgi:hypothetical protein
MATRQGTRVEPQVARPGTLMCWWAGRGLGRARASARAPGGEATGQNAIRKFVLGVFPALLWGALV